MHMKKRILSMVLVISIMLTCCLSIVSANSVTDRVSLSNMIVLKVGESFVYSDGVRCNSEDGRAAELVGDTVFVPTSLIRGFDGITNVKTEKNKAYINSEKAYGVFENNSKLWYQNGVEGAMNTAAFSYDSGMYIPVRAVAELLDCEVLWDDAGFVFLSVSDKNFDRMKTQDAIAVVDSYFTDSTEIGTSDGAAEYVSREHEDAIDLYLDANSSASGADGSAGKPFKSVEKAQSAVRKLTKTMDRDIVVHIADGEYFIDETLSFTTLDSGRNGHKVIWEAESGDAVISGGIHVSGWTKARGTANTYKTTVNADYVRQLYINGEKRSVVTSDGFRVHDAYKNKSGEYKGFYVENSIIPSDAYSAGMEIATDMVNWASVIMPIESVSKYTDDLTNVACVSDSYNQALTLTPAVDQGTLLYLKNAKFLLGKEGEWYFDPQTKELYYTPKKGEDMSRLDAIVPKTEGLMDIRGTEKERVSNIEFYGLKFKYCAWNDTSENIYRPFQSSELFYRGDDIEYSMVPAGVTLTNTDNISFLRNSFEHFGAAVLGIHLNDSNITVEGNVIYDAVDNGIVLGTCRRRHEHPSAGEEMFYTENVTIRNNLISNIGTEHLGAIGIESYSTKNSVIEHNHIKELPYSAIAFGWLWSSTTEQSQKNVMIKNNLIESVCQRVFDGAGIYSLGNLGYSEVSGNYIKRVFCPFPSPDILGSNTINYGIYLDECSSFVTYENNVIDEVSKGISVQKDNADGTSRVILRNNWSTTDDNWYTRAMNTGVDIVSMEGGVREEPNVFDPAQPPDEVTEIKQNAGIEEEFAYIETDYNSKRNYAPTIDMQTEYTGMVYDPIKITPLISDDSVPFERIKISWITDEAPEGSYTEHPRTKIMRLTSVYVETPDDPNGSEITFSLPGEYKIRFCASDGEYTAEKELHFSISDLPDDLVNVAAGKTGWCSNLWDEKAFSVDWATDGDMHTEFATKNWSMSTDPEQPYLIIDLEDEYEIDRVVYRFRNTSEQDGAFRSVRVQLSDDKDFNDFYTVGAVGMKPHVPFGCTWAKTVNSDKKFRYLRVRGTERSNCIVVPEIEVYVKEAGAQ